MQFGRFRLGMRTIKSALAVFLCILFFHLTQRGIPMIAALSAVFSLRQDLTTTVSFGKSRIIRWYTSYHLFFCQKLFSQ